MLYIKASALSVMPSRTVNPARHISNRVRRGSSPVNAPSGDSCHRHEDHKRCNSKPNWSQKLSRSVVSALSSICASSAAWRMLHKCASLSSSCCAALRGGRLMDKFDGKDSAMVFWFSCQRGASKRCRASCVPGSARPHSGALDDSESLSSRRWTETRPSSEMDYRFGSKCVVFILISTLRDPDIFWLSWRDRWQPCTGSDVHENHGNR